MIEVLLAKLDKVKQTGNSQWKACCPAHEDKTPSLSIKELRDGRILLHCFAGCLPVDIVNSVGMQMTDLFPDGAYGELKGWAQMISRKGREQQEHDRLILAMAEEDRAKGIKHSTKDKEIILEAYKRSKANG